MLVWKFQFTFTICTNIHVLFILSIHLKAYSEWQVIVFTVSITYVLKKMYKYEYCVRCQHMQNIFFLTSSNITFLWVIGYFFSCATCRNSLNRKFHLITSKITMENHSKRCWLLAFLLYFWFLSFLYHVCLLHCLAIKFSSACLSSIKQGLFYWSVVLNLKCIKYLS